MNIIIFFISALLEIVGSYFAIKFVETKSLIDLLVGIIILTMFGLSLSYHDDASGRIFAAYGGIYIFSSILWIKYIDNVTITYFDIVGGLLAIIGASLIYFQPD